MVWTKALFWVAGIYGLLVLVPQFFMEANVPPPLNHPEYFYGFLGVGTAWQIAFLIIAADPLRFRPIIVAGAFEKMSFAMAVAALYWLGRVPTVLGVFAAIDFAFAILFIMAFGYLGRLT